MVKTMQIKFLRFMMSLKSSNLLFLIMWLVSCSNQEVSKSEDRVFTEDENYDYSKTLKVRCTPGDKLIEYKIGDIPCRRNELRIGPKEKLKIYFKVTNKNSSDLYEYGFQELLRYKNGKIIERLKLRRDDDAYWSEVPFVRIRKQKYVADLDGDGYQEFAIFPFSSGSAIWGTVRIFSLKEKIEFWGKGRYQFEGDTFVQLNCMKCSKFNPEACKSCE